jgi:dihydrofolate reductase
VTALSLVAAVDRHLAIGRDNQLPWHLPDDLKRFKALTLDKPILMGRKTAQSLGRALPRRENLVLTRSGQAPFAGMRSVATLDEALAIAGEAELMVIGGGEIYSLTLPLATRLYLTHVDTEVVGASAFFPQVDPDEWRVVDYDSHAIDDKHAFGFEFVDYQRLPS